MNNLITIKRKDYYINRNNVVDIFFNEEHNIIQIKVIDGRTITFSVEDRREFEKILDRLDKGDVDYGSKI